MAVAAHPPTAVTAELAELLQVSPTLYHMAERGSWPASSATACSARPRCSTCSTVQRRPPRRHRAPHRPAGVTLRHPVHGTAVVRDQKPMSDAALQRCLTGGMTPADWYARLNGKVFFWLSRPRLLRLLGGRAYRGAEHDVLELDAAALVAAHRTASR